MSRHNHPCSDKQNFLGSCRCLHTFTFLRNNICLVRLEWKQGLAKKKNHLWEKLGDKTRHDHIGTLSFGILRGLKQFIFISHCDDGIFLLGQKRLKRRTLMPNNISWAIYFPAEFTGVNHRRYWDHGPVDQGLAASMLSPNQKTKTISVGERPPKC